MQTETFDTHTFYQSLVESGMPQDQATAVIKTMETFCQHCTITLETKVSHLRDSDKTFSMPLGLFASDVFLIASYTFFLVILML